MTANLTRDEARTRAESITVDSYQVELDLTGGDATFRSVSEIRFGCARPIGDCLSAPPNLGKTFARPLSELAHRRHTIS